MTWPGQAILLAAGVVAFADRAFGGTHRADPFSGSSSGCSEPHPGEASLPAYTACAPGLYGPACSEKCACAAGQECDEGPIGTGACFCSDGTLVTPGESCGAQSRHVTVDAVVAGPNATGLGRLRFDERFLQAVRVDRLVSRRQRQVLNATVSLAEPTPWKSFALRGERPLLLGLDPATAELLGLNATEMRLPSVVGETIDVLSGAKALSGSTPFCHCYGGHQFGNWAGQLGDGRAVSMGVVHPVGRPNSTITWELSLKGAGRTPFSRRGDGRAVLQSVCREFLGAAALAAIGVPTVRSLGVVGSFATDDAVWRDEWYTGKPVARPPGILLRAAPSLLRFGSLQLAAKRQGPGASGAAGIARYVLGVLSGMEAADDATTRVWDHGASLDDGAKIDGVATIDNAAQASEPDTGGVAPSRGTRMSAEVRFHRATPTEPSHTGPCSTLLRVERGGSLADLLDRLTLSLGFPARQLQSSEGQALATVAQVLEYAADGAVVAVSAGNDGGRYEATAKDPIKGSVPAAVREQCLFAGRSQPSCASKFSLSTANFTGKRTEEHTEALACLLERLVARVAALTAAWDAAGFAHGVMNTDNMSILGITIDLNVFGFQDRRDPLWAPNYIDDEQRYAFGAQADMAKWNLQRLADALTGTAFVGDGEADRATWHRNGGSAAQWLPVDAAAKIMSHFDAIFSACKTARHLLRIGLGVQPAALASSGAEHMQPSSLQEDVRRLGSAVFSSPAQMLEATLVEDWLLWLETSAADYARASRALAEVHAHLAKAASAVAEEGRVAIAQAVHLITTASGADTAHNIVLTDVLWRLSQAVATSPLLSFDSWARQVRRLAPRYTLRSNFTRGILADDSLRDQGASILGALLARLQRPFDEHRWDVTDDERAGDGISLAQRVKRGLSQPPAQAFANVQTSCGGQ